MGTDAGLELPQEIANQPLKAPSWILLYHICVIHGCPYGLTGSASRLGTTHHLLTPKAAFDNRSGARPIVVDSILISDGTLPWNCLSPSHL